MNSEPKFSIQRGKRIRALIPLLLLPHVIGCMSAKLDMRNIENPIMLNALTTDGETWEARRIDSIRVEASTDRDYWTIGNWEADVDTVVKDAELVTFNKIGGHSDRAISAFKIHVGGIGMNFFFLISGSAFVKGTGDVVEIGPVQSPDSADSDEGGQEAMGEAN